MPKLMVYFSLCILIVPAFCMAGDFATIAANANKRVGGYHVETVNAQDALHDLAQREAVVIGVDAVLPEKREPIIFDFPGGTVADLLNMFVVQSPGYEWREDRGVIHVTSSHVSLTDVVFSYPGARDMKLRLMWEDIVTRPEVAAWLKTNDCRREGFVHPKDFKRHRGLISIPAGSMTVSHFLDEVAIQSGGNYWSVLQRFSPKTHVCYVSVAAW